MHVSSIRLLQPLIDTLRSAKHPHLWEHASEPLEAEAFLQHVRSGVRDDAICGISPLCVERLKAFSCFHLLSDGAGAIRKAEFSSGSEHHVF